MDLCKAYNNVNQNFLNHVLANMGFPNKWISWIANCIGDTLFSIFINGSPVGFFKGSCGMRQGDPLSPLSFHSSVGGIYSMAGFGNSEGLNCYYA